MIDERIVEGAIVALGLAFLGFCLYQGMRCERRHRLVCDLPTSKTSAVFIGLVEVHGCSDHDRPLSGHLSGQACVWHQWSVEESWSRTVTESYTDSNGKPQTRTRTESGWTTIASGGEDPPFDLVDDHGSIRIVPTGAMVEPLLALDTCCGRSDPRYYQSGPTQAISDSDHRRRFRESILPMGADLSVIGQAREQSDRVAVEIAHDPQAPLFLISTRSERAVAASFRWHGIAWCLAGLLPIAALLLIDDVAVREVACGAGGLYLFCWLLAWLMMAYNSLVELRQRVRQAWANVDVQIKRRADLIPGLVAIVAAMAHHEQDTQVQLAQLRTQAQTTPPGVAGPDAHILAPTLAAIAERYPQLRADASFSRLAAALSDCEERIALARSYFNDIATFLNTRREVLPDRLIAGLAGIRPQVLMLADGFERSPPAVRIGDDAESAIRPTATGGARRRPDAHSSSEPG